MQYISVIEYLMGRTKLEDLSSDLIANVNTIVPRINDLLERFGEYRKVSSGYRRMEDHLATYAQINAKKKSQGLPEVRVPMSSKHLTCEACDLEDHDDRLKAYLKTETGLKAMEELGLWQEDPNSTDTWVHLQIVPPKSGKRVFLP